MGCSGIATKGRSTSWAGSTQLTLQGSRRFCHLWQRLVVTTSATEEGPPTLAVPDPIDGVLGEKEARKPKSTLPYFVVGDVVGSMPKHTERRDHPKEWLPGSLSSSCEDSDQTMFARTRFPNPNGSAIYLDPRYLRSRS